MEIMGLDFKRIVHDCFRVKGKSVVVYFDPYKVENDSEKADIIFVSHDHFDHCSREDIEKVADENTVIVANTSSNSKMGDIDVKNIRLAKPGDEFEVKECWIKAVPAYNIDKFRAPDEPFHPKGDEYCGYIIEMDGIKVYHAGDTDNIPELQNIECDIALLPVSGTYVMTAKEAVEAAKVIRPKVAIPMHYGDIVGTEEDAEEFRSALEREVKVEVL